MRQLLDLFRAAFRDWLDDKAARLGASLAYYAIFSIGPLLLIVIAVAGLVFGREVAQDRVLGTLAAYVGQGGAAAIRDAIEGATHGGRGVVATIIGIAVLLVGATGLFGALEDALNTVWEVKPKPRQGLLALLRVRLLSFTVVIGTGFLLLVSFVVAAALAALGDAVGDRMPGGEAALAVLNFLLSLAVSAAIFALIFKVLPDVKLRWRDVATGALVTALLFSIGQFLLGLYIGHVDIASAYGAAGSLIVVLVWIYYSAQILFFGAEFTQVWTRRFGSGAIPEPHATKVDGKQRRNEGLDQREPGRASAP